MPTDVTHDHIITDDKLKAQIVIVKNCVAVIKEQYKLIEEINDTHTFKTEKVHDLQGAQVIEQALQGILEKRLYDNFMGK